MKVLVIGSGGREHALAWKLSREPHVESVICAPGNPGIAAVARCLPADISAPAELLAIAASQGVDLTVVGPELPLSHGVVDVFTAAGRAIVGPSRAAAGLERSKAFAKDFMARHRVPTAAFRVRDSPAAALDAIDGYLDKHYRAHLKPLLDYLKKQNRVVPLSEMSDHFAFSQLHPWHLESACEWLERKGLLQKLSAPFKLTKRSQERVEEPAYFLDS